MPRNSFMPFLARPMTTPLSVSAVGRYRLPADAVSAETKVSAQIAAAASRNLGVRPRCWGGWFALSFFVQLFTLVFILLCIFLFIADSSISAQPASLPTLAIVPKGTGHPGFQKRRQVYIWSACRTMKGIYRQGVESVM